MQVHDYKAIENLISIAFYAASYLYEIGKEYAHDDYTVMLASLGDGKGKVTRHFILKGIHVVMNYCKFELHRRKHNLSDEFVDGLMSMANRSVPESAIKSVPPIITKITNI